jgi:hypothetical protein
VKTLLLALTALLAVSSLAMLSACSQPGVEVTRDEFGEEWPLTVEVARLWCERPRAVLLEADGTTYGLNGAGQALGHPSPEPIWRDDPDAPEGTSGIKVSLRPLINRGLELCDE